MGKMALIGVTPVKSARVAGVTAPTDLFDPNDLAKAIESIRTALAGAETPPAGNGLTLKSVSVELGVDVSGKVGLIVTSGSVDVSGKITVTSGR